MSFFTLEISGSISGKLWLMLKKWGFIDRNTAGAYTAGRKDLLKFKNKKSKCKIKEKAAGTEALRHRVFVLLCAFVNNF